MKRIFFPGLNVGTRKRIKFGKYLQSGPLLTLDAGCGNGAFSYLAYSLGNTVLGINTDADQIHKCEAFRDFQGLNEEGCRFKVHNIHQILSLHEKFDQIVCFETLEHLDNDREVLSQFHTILKPNGTLHLCTPRRKRKPYYGEIISEKEDGGHVRSGYELADLEDLLGSTGFSIVATDRAIGFFSLRVEEILNWTDVNITSGLSRNAYLIVQALFFISLYPLTFLDMFSDEYLCIYVQAKPCQLD
jgi:SAM-dependent methyltransferase